MGRDTGAVAARLERLLRPPDHESVDAGGDGGGGASGGAVPGAGDVGGEETGWSRLLAGGDRGRHATQGPPQGADGWRLGGVPTGAAVAAVVAAAVAAVLLLGGGGGAEEVLVGPAAAGGASVQPVGSADPGPSGSDAPAPGTIDDASARALLSPVATPVTPVTPVTPGAPVTPVSSPTAPGPLVVHVDGAVSRPGVVTVPAGARVSDAVAAAGGLTSEADTRLVNLARLLADGELVVVPVPGEAPAPVAGAGGASAPGGAGPDPGSAAPGPLDLNSADVGALDALPGIGPVLAERIVAHRDDVGPFATVDDLDAVSGIGPTLMSDLRELVRV